MELIISNRWTTVLVNGLDLPRQIGSFGHDGWMDGWMRDEMQKDLQQAKSRRREVTMRCGFLFNYCSAMAQLQQSSIIFCVVCSSWMP
jgi:hypothetical protein